MSKTDLNEAGRASVDELHTLAAQGVQRALAVRMSELSAEQMQQVGGGLSGMAFDEYCGTGPRLFPKLGGGGGLVLGDVVIINGQYARPLSF